VRRFLSRARVHNGFMTIYASLEIARVRDGGRLSLTQALPSLVAGRNVTVIGHSLGGIAMILAAGDMPDILGLITIASAADLDHLRGIIEHYPPDPSDGSRKLTIGGHVRTVRPTFLEDLHRHDVLAAVGELQVPMLVVHSRSDELVDFSHAERLVQSAGSNGTLLALDGADHLLSDRATAKSVADQMAAWMAT